ncbi:hypothetical protein CBG25_03935 [Arsenophonus sp. ENCA]|uniref:hypothetical protein n=1 Tax=Arsenophonus sp. ENCA TaxID=1987579 RepID=UPI000BDB9E6C|nr:hypothetical protein [Arsenophonus sp. ENCA]PAV08408.1 hypothetical protein CBG25_03935 [Arsenophonus sp. ENCA]
MIDGDKIFVDGNLDLHDTSITRLPDNLRVGGWLDLGGTSITRLPDNLSVGGWFNLRRTGISSLPDNLKVNRFIHLHPEEITNIAYRKLWKHSDYTVFAAWINGECCVVVNEKIYTLGEFFRGAQAYAADVAKAARECVAELMQRWKGTCWMPTPGKSEVIKMKVSDLKKAHEMTIDLRGKIDGYKRLINGIELQMCIGSTWIDESLVDAIKPAVLTEFQRRIEEIKEELAAFGVDADELG